MKVVPCFSTVFFPWLAIIRLFSAFSRNSLILKALFDNFILFCFLNHTSCLHSFLIILCHWLVFLAFLLMDAFLDSLVFHNKKRLQGMNL